MGQHHARAIARLAPRASLVAVADPVASARDAVVRICHGATAYTSPEEMLERGDIDVVHVCTSPETHEAVAEAALAAGCHVYVEKPFVSSTAAAARLIASAHSHELKLCAGHQLLYETPSRELLTMLPALGQIIHVESFFSFKTVRRSPSGRAPLRADLQLLDILPHPVYLLLQLLELAVPRGHVELTAMETGPAGTFHALVRRGALTGTLVVTLEGRPVESYLRVVGTNGAVHADFVRGTVQRLIGPGVSGIDKVLNPFRLARQLATGTTGALVARLRKRQRSYPGLSEIFAAFYASIQGDGPVPLSDEQMLETVRIWERVARALDAPSSAPVAAPRPAAHAGTVARAVVTGGTGFLGKEVVRALASHGRAVRVLARRTPAAWERIANVEYVASDLGEPLSDDALRDADVVIHCAAETAGGWDEHRRNSVEATERVLHAAAAAGVRRVVHVSSLAVLSAAKGSEALAEDSPLEAHGSQRGPYVWGKLESERRAVQLGTELGISIRIVRPGALVDYQHFEPPGRLGKRIGNMFVAVGSPHDTLGIADVGFAGTAIAWMASDFDAAPRILNLLTPEQPTRRALVSRLKQTNPDLTVVWLPTVLLIPLSWAALGAQKLLRRGKPPINVAKVFASQRYDMSLSAAVEPRVLGFFDACSAHQNAKAS